MDGADERDDRSSDRKEADVQFMSDRKRAMVERALRESNGSFVELRRRLDESHAANAREATRVGEPLSSVRRRQA